MIHSLSYLSTRTTEDTSSGRGKPRSSWKSGNFKLFSKLTHRAECCVQSNEEQTAQLDRKAGNQIIQTHSQERELSTRKNL